MWYGNASRGWAMNEQRRGGTYIPAIDDIAMNRCFFRLLRAVLHVAHAIFAALLLLAPLPASAQRLPQPIHAPVSDFPGILPQAMEDAIDWRLAAIRAKKGVDLRVLIVDAPARFGFRGDTPAFAETMFREWVIGGPSERGALLVVALAGREGKPAHALVIGKGIDRRRARAMEEALADQLVPRLAAGRVPEGIEAGIFAMLDAADFESLPDRSSWVDWINILAPFVAIAVFIFYAWWQMVRRKGEKPE